MSYPAAGISGATLSPVATMRHSDRSPPPRRYRCG
jgi:hypothetical protein